MAGIELGRLVLRELHKLNANGVIPFPLVFYRLGCILHLDKETSRLVLQELERKRLIRIHDFHGVEILRTKKT